MKQCTVLIIAVFALGGLTLTSGCKSDCEKVVENFMKFNKAKAGEGKRAGVIKMCEETLKKGKPVDLAQIECMAKATSKEELAECGDIK